MAKLLKRKINLDPGELSEMWVSKGKKRIQKGLNEVRENYFRDNSRIFIDCNCGVEDVMSHSDVPSKLWRWLHGAPPSLRCSTLALRLPIFDIGRI